MNQAIFELENVSVVLNEKRILSEISLKIPANKITTLIGPSGAGKTTLLRLFNRLNSPTEGKIFFNNEQLEKIDVLGLRKTVGMVFQQPALFPGTVMDNLNYGPSLQGTVDEGYALHCLKLVGLDEDFKLRKVDNLSGGEQQRVALARTLANKPKIVLLDEPTASLDPASTEQLEKLIIELNCRFKLTFIWITHDLTQAKKVSDYTIFLAQGKLVEAGKQVFSKPEQELTKLFINGKLLSGKEGQ